MKDALIHSSNDWEQVVRDFLMTAEKPLIVVLGPTASGKTGFSIEIAQFIASELKRKAEVVNADSRQLYKYLDIGTAKITEAEMQSVPHHLFSVLDPKEPVTIAWYQTEATRVIDEILKRKSVPLLVGGSMLYISSIIDGLKPIDKSDPALRTKLEHQYAADAGISLHKELEKIDPESVANIPRENKVYLIRALEIFHLTGQPKSAQKRLSDCNYDLLILGVRKDREELNQRINKRTHQLLHQGWLEEVQGLLEKEYTADDPGMISVGYKEIVETIKNSSSDRKNLEEKIAAKTRQYAKRQMTWWRHDSRIMWIDV